MNPLLNPIFLLRLSYSYLMDVDRLKNHSETDIRNKESIQVMNQAYELDPLSPSVGTGVGRMYHFARQFDKAKMPYTPGRNENWKED